MKKQEDKNLGWAIVKNNRGETVWVKIMGHTLNWKRPGGKKKLPGTNANPGKLDIHGLTSSHSPRLS